MDNKACIATAALAILAAAPASASDCPPVTAFEPTHSIAAVNPDLSLRMEDGGSLMIAGIDLPRPPLSHPRTDRWPPYDFVRSEMETRYAGQDITALDPSAPDRHGRRWARIYLLGGELLASDLIAAGLARIDGASPLGCETGLVQLERRARTEALGIWSNPEYSARDAADPEALLQRTGRFEIIEGIVLNADRSGNWVYLNFGPVWKTDFTIIITAAVMQEFEKLGRDPLAYEGRLIEARGFVLDQDGPRIYLEHPGQVELLSDQ